jgi:hypothetical protein
MTNELTTYDAIPDYEIAIWHDDNSLANKEATKWSGKIAPPPVGTEIVVTMWTTPGVGIVTGYFTEGGWLGLLVRMYTAPEWHRKKNPDGMAYIFGPEFRLAELTGTPNDIDLAALADYATENGRDWKQDLRDDWMKARTRNGRYWVGRGNILHALRNSPDFGPTGLDKFRLNIKEKVS